VPAAAKVAFSLLILDGFFYDLAATTTNITTAGGTVTNPGDVTTRRMTLTFTGVSGAWTMVLTNTTTGVSVTLTGSGTTPVGVDVEAFTATQGGANVIGNVAHSGDNYFMVLAPGNNVFTLTGGASVAVAAKAAWL
jgi:phage-related protein